MKKDKDSKVFISFSIPKDVSDKDFTESLGKKYEEIRRAFIHGLLSDDKIDQQSADGNHPPQKKADQDCTAYLECLRNYWGHTVQVMDTHERWKAKHRNGVLERDLRQRIIIQLRELLKSGFLRKDYIETGMPEEDCKDARQWLKDEGLASQLGEIEGADWKLALLRRHLLQEQAMHCLLCAADNVGFYISEMQERLHWEDVEAFFRFDTYMHLVYEDMCKLNDEEESNQSRGARDSEQQKLEAVKTFVGKILQLADDVYNAWNGKEANLGGRMGSATIVIKRDELKAYVKLAQSKNFEELAECCFPPKADNKLKFCKYVAQLYKRGYFGKLPKKELAKILAPIVELKPGTVQGNL